MIQKIKTGLFCLLLIGAFVGTSCEQTKTSKKKDDTTAKDFPPVKNLTAYPKTVFLPTLEHDLPAGKNGIYGASLLYAWEELQKTYKPPFVISPESKDLLLINASQSFRGVLKKGEYITSTQVEDNTLIIRALFEKTLAFKTKLADFSDALTFDNTKVKSFGVKKRYRTILFEMFSLWYYENDDNFILKITPQDEEHEILLCKFGETKPSIASYLQKITEWRLLGQEMKKDRDKLWRFVIDHDADNIVIPKFRFNIEKYYDTSKMGFTDATGKKPYVKKVYQKIAFLLNENGAKIKDDSRIEVAKEEKAKPHPKNLVFNKPFLLLLKRKDNLNPYFAMWVNNPELMEKE